MQNRLLEPLPAQIVINKNQEKYRLGAQGAAGARVAGTAVQLTNAHVVRLGDRLEGAPRMPHLAAGPSLLAFHVQNPHAPKR